MAIVIRKLKEAIEFAKENGYLLAVYTRQDKTDTFILCSDNYTVEDEDEDKKIKVRTVGHGVDYTMFITTDNEWAFKLHNNFNLRPKITIIIPPKK